MAEICTAPKILMDEDGEKYVVITPDMSIADICRWLMTHREMAIEVRYILKAMLNDTYGQHGKKKRRK